MVQKISRHPRRSDQEWLAIIHECRNSGMSDRAWCEMHNIQPSNFYYHIRRLRANACEIPMVNTVAVQAPQEIVEIPMDELVEKQAQAQPHISDIAVRLSSGGLQAEIFNSADSQTIYHTIAALQRLC